MATKVAAQTDKKPKRSARRQDKSKATVRSKATAGKVRGLAKTTTRPSRTGHADPVRQQPRSDAKSLRPTFVPRAMPAGDDDDVLMSLGAGGGAGFGRCGGRLLGSRLEQSLCDRLSQAGVAHSHSPRHFEIRFKEDQVAAYAPMIVLRGRGREGKSVVIECAEERTAPILRKVTAFRAQYGQEFYVILVAPDEVLDEVEIASYDESCAAVNVNTLISRLAE
jgi:hypothetical protein